LRPTSSSGLSRSAKLAGMSVMPPRSESASGRPPHATGLRTWRPPAHSPQRSREWPVRPVLRERMLLRAGAAPPTCPVPEPRAPGARWPATPLRADNVVMTVADNVVATWGSSVLVGAGGQPVQVPGRPAPWPAVWPRNCRRRLL
jgi:hypothetical protein